MRYSRQIVLLGKGAQSRLGKATVVIVGVGGIGSAAAEYLARAGVNLRLIDRDVVEENNLQRQLFEEQDIGKPKAVAAKERLQRINSRIKIEAVVDDLNVNTADLLLGANLILDGTDNFEARFLINEVCIRSKIPFIYGGAIETCGIIAMIKPGGPCLRCLFPELKGGLLPTCEQVGVLGPVAGLVGIIQAAEAIKFLTNKKRLPRGKIIHVDLKNYKFRMVGFRQKIDCPVCAKRKFPILHQRKRLTWATSLCGRDAVQILPPERLDLNIQKLASKLQNVPEFGVKNINKHVLTLEHSTSQKHNEIIIFKSGRIIVKGTKSVNNAKSIAARLISF